MTNNTITSIVKYSIFACIFLIPFVFLIAPSDPSVVNPGSAIFLANGFFFPFIASKAFVFRIIVEVMFALWLFLVLRDKKYVPKFSWITVAVTSFAVVALIADLLGLNPLRSIWSNFERMEGWMMIVHMWAYFMVISSVFDEKKLWHRFFNVSLVAAIFVSIYGFVQLGGGAIIHQGSTRLDASLGNAIYLAVYMLFHVFIALYLGAVAWAKKNYGKLVYYILLVLVFAFMIFETATRGTLIGLVGGGLVMLAILVIFDKTHKAVRVVSGSLIALTILLAVLFYLNKDAAFIQNNETLRRMASISWQDTKTQARGFIWPMAVKGVFESPKSAIIGIGQENFNYIFNANYNPKMYNQEQWFDRVHNIYLDWLVAGGLLGLIVYLSLFVFALISVWKSELTIKERAILVGLIVAYGIHNIFVFDNLASYVFFFSILGFAHFIRSDAPIQWIDKRIHTNKENFVIVRDYAVAPVLLILFIITLYCINVRPIQANHRLVDALRGCSSSAPVNAALALDLYKKALSLDQSMANQEIREQLLTCGSVVANSASSDTQKQEFLNFVSEQVDTHIASAPGDARMYVLAGFFFNSLGQFGKSMPLLVKAHELSPAKQSIDFQLAATYINTASTDPTNLDKAIQLFKEAYEGDPTYENAKNSYLSALIATGKEAEAKKIFGTDPSLYENAQVARVYASVKNYAKSIALYKKLLEKDPKSLDLAISLAQVQYTAGLKYDTVSTLQNLIVAHPELKAQIEQSIKEIQAGK
jgi:O-antigen ligase